MNINKNQHVIFLAHLLRYSDASCMRPAGGIVKRKSCSWLAGLNTVIQMIKDTEKRIHRRHDCDATIKWTYFSRTTFDYGQEIFYRAKALNFSKSGLYFETTHSLKPGTTLLFRTEAFGKKVLNFEGCKCLRSISLVEIKWCQEFLTNGESYFGIGARYPIPY